MNEDNTRLPRRSRLLMFKILMLYHLDNIEYDREFHYLTVRIMNVKRFVRIGGILRSV